MTGHVTGHIVTGRLALVNSLKIGPVLINIASGALL